MTCFVCYTLSIPHPIVPDTVIVRGKIIEKKETAYGMTWTLYQKKKVLVYTKEDCFHLGDQIQVKGKVKETKKLSNFSLFDYQKYLKSKKIALVVEAEEVTLLQKNKSVIFFLKQKIQNYVKGFKNELYIRLLILGENTLEEEKYQAYQTIGIAHLLAISGMHIHFLVAILSKLLKKRKKGILCSFLFFYCLFVRKSPGFLRAILVEEVTLLFPKIKRKETTVFLFFLFLLWNPYLIYHTGFLLSFFLSYGLSIISITGNYLKKLLKTSYYAFLISAPILINQNFELNFLSIVWNLVYVPFVSFLLFPLTLFSFFIKPLEFLLTPCCLFFEKTSSLAAEITTFTVTIPHLSLLAFVLLYGTIYLTIRFKKPAIFILFLIFHLSFYQFQQTITYLDVGQGDATILHFHQKNVLIDTGGLFYQDLTKQVLIPSLKARGIDWLDYLILSHGDYDHMGEAINFVSHFPVKKVMFNNDSYNELEMELIKVLEKKRIKYEKGTKELAIGSDKLYFLQTKDYHNENDNSNVLYFKRKKYQFLWMGDAGIKREKEIIDHYHFKNIDFIKIGHHGSNTSSSKYFIEQIKPKNCFISVGKNNRYGHPKKIVLDILDDYCDIYRTDVNGSIEIKINRNNYKIKTHSP